MHDRKITVVVPVYNVENYLRKCLDSLRNQTHTNLEVILIDDGSGDASGAICEEYAALDSRFICRHQENRGVSAARNYGKSLGTGDYYHFLDSDDYLETDAYETALDAMERSGADACAFEYYVTYPSGETVRLQSQPHYGVKNRKEAYYQTILGGSPFLCTKLLPKQAVENIELREDIYRGEDSMFASDAIKQLDRVVFIDKPLLHYVQSEESACRGVFRPSQLTAVKMMQHYEKDLSENYPEWLDEWYVSCMHLCVMLYGDMYYDKLPYSDERKAIYTEFRNYYKKVPASAIHSVKNRVKFAVFNLSPRLFCAIHRIRE